MEWYVMLVDKNGEDFGDTPKGPFPTKIAAEYAAEYQNETDPEVDETNHWEARQWDEENKAYC
jgi:hypothetical protein